MKFAYKIILLIIGICCIVAAGYGLKSDVAYARYLWDIGIAFTTFSAFF